MKNPHKIIEFKNLKNSDLLLDAMYEGGSEKHIGDDPISKLVGCGNQGGFRFLGPSGDRKLCVLYSDLMSPDWPDFIDFETGRFTYYGDNKKPGCDIHDKTGNSFLRDIFNCLHTELRKNIPPIFIFTKGPKGKDAAFRGLAVPGAIEINQTDDLISIWKTKNSKRFLNYKATFTILKAQVISRSWIRDIQNGNPLSSNAPSEWVHWVKIGKYFPLRAPKTKQYRTKIEQTPKNKLQKEILDEIISHFKNHVNKEYAFEKCAVEIFTLMEPSKVIEYDLTRPWRDGGRDAIGKYRIGNQDSHIGVIFALEAKCGYAQGNGVKEMSRLISRLLHRQFGVFVTTSYLRKQAYEEITEDGHPVVVISGGDISSILIANGYSSRKEVRHWLRGIDGTGVDRR